MSKSRTTNTSKPSSMSMSKYPKKQKGSTSMKCFECRRKLKLSETIGNKCKCEHIFCNHHKLSTAHTCAYDYKNEFKTRLSKSVSKVEAEKLVGF